MTGGFVLPAQGTIENSSYTLAVQANYFTTGVVAVDNINYDSLSGGSELDTLYTTDPAPVSFGPTLPDWGFWSDYFGTDGNQ